MKYGSRGQDNTHIVRLTRETLLRKTPARCSHMLGKSPIKLVDEGVTGIREVAYRVVYDCRNFQGKMTKGSLTSRQNFKLFRVNVNLLPFHDTFT